MTEYLTRKELRELTLWGNQEPEALPEGTFEEMKAMFPQWEPRQLTNEYLAEKVEIPPIKMTKKQLVELETIVGTENLKFDPKTRVLFSHGGSAEDITRIRLGQFLTLCDAMVTPKTEEEIMKVLQFCEKYNIPCIPYAGRTGVTRSLEFVRPGIAMSLHPHFSTIVEFKPENRMITVGAGIYGPELDRVILPQGLTLSHYPQSWEQSQVGGWIAARGAGQNSTLYGKIESMVMSLRVITSQGAFESQRAPANATGPQWFPYFIGSEGTLGIITQATLRLHPTSESTRTFESYLFHSYEEGVKALKAICQTEFKPGIARLSDGSETAVYMVIGHEGKPSTFKQKFVEWYLNAKNYHDRQRSILLLIFEGSAEYVKECELVAEKYCKENNALSAGGKYAQSWFKDRFEHPHLRDLGQDMGILTDTLETAGTWDQLLTLHKNTRKALREKAEIVTAHISHSYAEGSNMYFIYITPVERGNEINQIRDLQKRAVTAFKASGCVTSHHHGVGKAFSQWGHEEWQPMALAMAKGIKDKLDPKNVLNPGNFPFDK